MLKKKLCYLVLAAAMGLSSCATAQGRAIKQLKNYLKQREYYQTKEDYEKLIKEIKTPKEAQNYCNALQYQRDFHNYGEDDYWASFKVINERKKDDCDGGATAAAALLSDNGYPAKVLIAYTLNKWAHAVFLYEEKEKYGSVGINYGDYKEAEYETIGDLVKALNKSLLKDFEIYYVIDFSDSYDIIIHSNKDFSYLYREKRAKAKRYTINNEEYVLESSKTEIPD